MNKTQELQKQIVDRMNIFFKIQLEKLIESRPNEFIHFAMNMRDNLKELHINI